MKTHYKFYTVDKQSNAIFIKEDHLKESEVVPQVLILAQVLKCSPKKLYVRQDPSGEGDWESFMTEEDSFELQEAIKVYQGLPR